MLAFHHLESYLTINIRLNTKEDGAKEQKMCFLWPNEIHAWENLRGRESSACSYITTIAVNKE